MITNKQKAYFFAFLSVFFWATVATGFKIALSKLNFFTVLFIADWVAVVITFVALILFNKIKDLQTSTPNELLKSAVVALINPFGYYLVLFKAYSLLPAQVAQPLNFIWPIVLVLLSAPLLHQKLHFRSLLALAVSFSGILIISTQGNVTNIRIESPFGVFLAASSSILWALYWIFNKKDKRDDLVKLFLNFLFSGIYLVLLSLLTNNLQIDFSRSFWAAIYIGFFEMGITFIVWMYAVRLCDRTDKISNLIYLTPVLSLFFIHFVLGEEIFKTTYFGLILILAGILILNVKKPRK